MRSIYLSVRLLLCLSIISCQGTVDSTNTIGEVKIAGAMKNVMWKGELASIIQMDTISDRNGLYGIGPLAGLRGEILINDSRSFQSKVLSDSTMIVEETGQIGAPFFVYANQKNWIKQELPRDIESIEVLEQYLEGKVAHIDQPFVFKLEGSIHSGLIHIQNLTPGTKVSSPEEAHQGQVKYPLGNEEVEIIGFYSKSHHGIFTHHDTNIHLHLITKDEQMMGHVDEVECNKMYLYLPK